MRCQKRLVCCVILNRDGDVLSAGVNSCTPPGGKCARMGITSTKEGYDPGGCQSVHAERAAVWSLPPPFDEEDFPYIALLYGHSFCCDECEKALRDAGVEEIIYGQPD